MRDDTYVVLHFPESHSLLASAVVEPAELGGPRSFLVGGVKLSHAAVTAFSLDHRRVSQGGSTIWRASLQQTNKLDELRAPENGTIFDRM